jgi:nicotinate dehydrogenase subunit B
MQPTRRDFLRACGALIVSFNAHALPNAWAAQDRSGPADARINPKRLDAWLAVGADGMITAYTGKCDFGQGIFTAQTQLIAEELCVPLSRVRLVECDTSITPDQGHTSGSQSTPTNFNHQNLALAAATAREALLKLGAERLGLPAATLQVVDGVVTAPSGKTVRYEQLLGSGSIDLVLSPTAKRKPQAEWKILGKPVPSLDRVALMTGQFEFVHAVRRPGMLHGRVVRPPEMGATLAHADESSVSHVPGLVKVVTRGNYVGVVAETQYAAIVAARELTVRWNRGPKLPPQNTFYEHMQRQPSRAELSVDSGDTGARLSGGRHVFRATYTYPYQMHGSVGSSCAVAEVTPDGATVWSATQSAYPTRSIVATLLALPVEKVRVVYTRGSGCYGLNGADAVSFDAALLSQAVSRPVRVQFSRHDEMFWENFGSACVIAHRAALDDAGNIAVWDRQNWVAELGGRPGYDRPGNVIPGFLLGYEPVPFDPRPAKPPQGKLRNQSNAVPSYMAGCIAGQCGGGGTIRSERVLTHNVRSPLFTGSLRSPIRIQNTFANECFMDELAAAAKADPIEFRLRHLTEPRTIGVLRSVSSAARWQPGPLRAVSASPQGVLRGRGVACVAYEGTNGYAALVAEVEVDTQTGIVHPTAFYVAMDCGPVSNPDGLRNQTEGGVLQGMSRALVEEVTWDQQRVTSTDWETYHSLSLAYEMPPVEVVFASSNGAPASGAGETAITVTPAAIGNAIFAATGARLREVPFTPDRVKAALHQAAGGGKRA